MAEQFCTRALYSLVQVVHHRRSSLLALCVLDFVFSVVATLENLLVIRALMKASKIPVTVKKLFLSLAFSDLAAYDRYYQRLDIGIKWKQHSLLLSNSFGCEKLLFVSSRQCISSECYFYRI